MNIKVLILFVLSFVMTASVYAAPKPKMKEVKLSSHVAYSGYVVKKTPSGSGKLYVYNMGDLSKKDVLSGEFDGNKISDARLQFSHDNGPIFDGELMYEVKESCVVYTLLKGKLKGVFFRESQKSYFRIEITEPTTITRAYNGFCFSSLTLSSVVTGYAREYSNNLKNIPLHQKTKLQRVYELAEGIEECSGIAQTYEREIEFKGQDIVVREDGYYTCNRFDLPNGAYILKKDNRYELLNSKNYLLWDTKDIILKKVFDNGLISYNNNEDLAFNAAKSYLNNFKDAFKEYFTAETQEALDRIKYAPEMNVSSKKLKCLLIEYPDGRKFYGVLRAKEGYKSVTDFFTKIKDSSELPSAELYRDGVLTYPDGRQEIFVQGNTLTQLQEFSQNKEHEIAEKIQRVNLRLIVENEAYVIGCTLKGKIKSIELCYDELCLCLSADYDEAGRIVKTYAAADLSESKSTYHYDVHGRIDYSVTINQYADQKPEKIHIKYFYDDMGRLIRVDCPANNFAIESATYSYDDKGNLLDKDGKPLPIDFSRPQSSQRQYDDRGNIIREVRDEELIIYTIEYWD